MARFATTRWSVVLQARGDPTHSRRALDALCRSYREPVLAYVRSCGYDAASAEDLTQAFFTRFIEQAGLPNADPTRGRFRTYLLTALQRFLIDAHHQSVAIKRGGRVKLHGLDAIDDDVADRSTPERAFQRAWVHALVREALRRLRAEAKAAGKLELFEQLREFLAERPGREDYERVARALNLRRNTLAVAVHRLRARLRELVREQLADTSADAADIARELHELQASLEAALG